HCRRLATVERILNGGAPPAGLKINEARHVTGGDLETESVPLDCCAIEKLCVRPHGGHRRHLIDDDRRRRRIAQHREECNRRVVTAILVDSGSAAFGEQIEGHVRADCLLGVDLKPAIAVCCCLSELPGVGSTCGPEGDGGICERTTTCLDLTLDAYGGCDTGRSKAHQANDQTNAEHRLVDFAHCSPPSRTVRRGELRHQFLFCSTVFFSPYARVRWRSAIIQHSVDAENWPKGK